jgi:hypothetical protein
VFNDGFWEGLDVVVNALDNVNARSAAELAQLMGAGGDGQDGVEGLETWGTPLGGLFSLFVLV